MRWDTHAGRRARTAAALLTVWGGMIAGLAPAAGAADEPRGLGRLFRFGAKPEAATTAKPPADRDRPVPSAPRDGGGPAEPYDVGAPPPSRPSNVVQPYRSAGDAYQPLPNATAAGAGLNSQPGPSTPMAPPTTGGSRLVPQPRNARAVTQAPPLLTRVALGRSDDGHQFGMFLQVYADGTIIDTEGVHKVGGDALRPLVEALRAAELNRPRPFCGGPATDFIEQVHLVVYDQARGRLTATPVSFSGNMTGCDAGLRNLQAAIDALQAKISGAPTVGTAAVSPATPAGPVLGLTPPAAPNDSAPPAPLTPPPPATNPTAAPALGLTPLE